MEVGGQLRRQQIRMGLMNKIDVGPVRECQKRSRRPVPAIESRDWMTASETAMALGCSVATVHRLRRGRILGVAMLPAVPVGSRKFVFRKASIRRWQDQNESGAVV